MRIEQGIACTADRDAERRIVAEIDTKHEQVDERAYYGLEFRPLPHSHRAAENDVTLSGVHPQQGRQPREKYHVGRRGVLPGHAPQCFG